MGPCLAEHRLLNPWDWPTITTSLPISGETMVGTLPRLSSSDVLHAAEDQYFLRLISYALYGATTRLRCTIVPLKLCMLDFYASRLESCGSTPTPTAISPMPTRRPSASGGHVGITSPNISTTRIHRTGDSLHGFPVNITPNAPYYANSTPQQKVVHTLVNRLKNKAGRTRTALYIRLCSSLVPATCPFWRQYLSSRGR